MSARRAPNFFAGSPLDRAAHLRRDEGWLAEARQASASRLVPLWRGRHLVLWEGERVRAVTVEPGRLEVLASGAPLLGLAGGVPHFAVDLSDREEAEVLALLGGRGELADLKVVGTVLDAGEAALLAYARGLLPWHARHAFCGVCGAPTESRDAGHVRRCLAPGCGADHFPRTDPAVIMLVTHGDHCLLGHQHGWPEGMYSTLAGFLEPGESLEEAVAREVWEEAGIEVAEVEYHSSQPWPFPASLMVGFVARAATTAIDARDGELADARWFHRSELLSPEARPVRLPSPVSIARRLVEDWLAG